MTYSTLKVTLKQHHVILALFVYLSLVCIYVYFSLQHEKQALYASIDQQLETAALTMPYLLPKKLHHKGISAGSLSEEQDIKNTHALSVYTDNSDIIYIYTMVLRDGQILFTTSSVTEEDRIAGEDLTSWFDPYEDVDPRVFKVFEDQQKNFLEYSDKWGTFRSIFLPLKAEDDTLYVAAADITIDHINTLLTQHVYRTAVTGFLFLLFVSPIYFALTNRIRTARNVLLKTLEKQTDDLVNSEERLQLALKAANQSWFDLNLRTGESIEGEDYPRMLGYEPSEFISGVDEWQKHIHPDDREDTLQQFQDCLHTGEPLDVEYRRETKGGEWIWLHTLGEVIERDMLEQAVRMVGVHTHITERKHNEQMLRALAEVGSVETGDILKVIVTQLAVFHDMRYVYIALKDPNDPNHLTTRINWADGDFIDNIRYNLVGTPCEKVLSSDGVYIHDDDVQELFPKGDLLAEIRARCYIGIPLKSRYNQILGLVAMLNDRPMTIKLPSFELLESLAARAEIELERGIAEEKLNLSARVFSEAQEGIFITYPDGTVLDINPTFCEITGYSREEIIGKNPKILNSGHHSAAFYADMWSVLLEKGVWQGEVWNRKKNGDLYAEMLSISTLKDSEGKATHFVCFFSDITEAKEQQKVLELMAHYDVLTQLPNRALFADRFKQSIAQSKRSDTLLAVCFLDLDDFKPVNDNFGHEVGDQLLIEVALRLKANVREEDTVSRQGGDEFALLLGNLNSFEQCEQMLQRIHDCLAQAYLIENKTISISASMGYTVYPNDDADLDTLLRHADQAMYQSKVDGRNCFRLFNTEQDLQTSRKQTQLKEIQQALENEEFCLYYQPKVNMRTGEVFGAEALIRWMHPEKGTVSPVNFLSLVDGTELEILIGDWVISEAIKQLDIWKRQGYKLELSVNISCFHLQSPKFYSQLEYVLERHPYVDAHDVQLEILESSALGELNNISNIIRTCREALGITVALDDFGTGYSSLAHLRSLPASTVKIDQSFVRDMLDDPDDYAIIDGVIGLAASFNRDVIAEGVETIEHGLMLLVMGCDCAQGYGVARPMPAGEFIPWMKIFEPHPEWIECGSNKRTPIQNKVKLYQLVVKQWHQRFENNVLAAPTDVSHWPIMMDTKCHCGDWLNRAKHESLLHVPEMERLEKAHEKMHSKANEILNEYLNGNLNQARESLEDLTVCFEQLQIRF